MKNLYLSIVIACCAFILVVGFQNLILNQTAWIFFVYTNSSILAFLSALAGFLAGVAGFLFYTTLTTQEKEEDESI